MRALDGKLASALVCGPPFKSRCRDQGMLAGPESKPRASACAIFSSTLVVETAAR